MTYRTHSETDAQQQDRIERELAAAEQETWDTYVEPVGDDANDAVAWYWSETLKMYVAIPED